MALALPLFALLALGIADGGRAFYYREAVTNAARQALRTAATDTLGGVQPYAGTQACLGQGLGGTAVEVTKTAHVPFQAGDWSFLQPVATAAALESSSNGQASGSKIAGSLLAVTWHCLNGLPVGYDHNQGITDPSDSQHRSDSVEIRVSYQFSLLTPLVARAFGSGTPTIGADVVGRAEYP